MGKVQDTLSRIARRTRNSETPAIALIVPSQQKATKHSFPTTRAAVAHWLDAQSHASSENRIVALTRALKHSNRLHNSASERLKICSLFSPVVQAEISAVYEQFVGADIPYDNNTRNAFDTATTLLQELSYGYKIALVDVLLRRSKLNRLDRVQCIYLAMRYLGECGLRYSQSYMPWPEKFWRDINTLYWLAEKENALDVTIGTATAKAEGFPTTIGNLYATLATFTLSNTDHLRSVAMEELISLLTEYSNHISLSAATTDTASSNLYSVAINSRNPPAAHRYCVYTAEDQVRYLDLAALCEALQNAEQTLLTRLQVQKIIHIWSHRTKRSHARAISNLATTTVNGLKDVHALFRQRQASNAEVSGVENWTLVNRSSNGLCLRGNTRNNHQLQLGELVGCCISESDRRCYDPGVIRWIRNNDQDDLQIGIELIGSNVKAVLCEKSTQPADVAEPKLEALTFDLGTQGFQTTLILLPANRYRLGDILNLYLNHNSEETSSFKLTESIGYEGQFDCFRIDTATLSQPLTRTALFT